MKKIVLFAFNGEAMCFTHALLNGLALEERGHEAAIVIEGSATALVPELAKESNPFHRLFRQVMDKKLVAGACRACSSKMGVLEEIEAQSIPLLDEMKGHPSMAGWRENGWEIITF